MFVAVPALLPLTPEVLVTVPVLGKPLVGPMTVPPVGLMAVPLVGLMVVPLVAPVPLVVWAMAAVDAPKSNAAATERIFKAFIPDFTSLVCGEDQRLHWYV